MRSDAEFRAAVHVPRADLNLHRLAAGADHRGVQALVHVELRHGDIVFETAGNRVPPRMHGTQRRIAVLNRVDDDTHAHQIINVGEIVPAHDHLLVNGEVVLRAARHIGFDVLFVEILIDFGENLLQVHVALSGATGHQYHNLVVDLRIQNLEAEFFQLGFDGVHAKTVGERRIHIQRFTCLFLRVRLLDVTPCTGVVHTVGELDHQHAHVAAHRHHHFADGLGLGGIAVFHFGKLRDAVHQAGHRVAEFGAAFVERVVSVLHRVVQKARCHNQRPHAKIGEDLRHCKRMDDVRLAGFTPLRRMLVDGAPVGSRENAHVLVGMVVFTHLEDWFKRVKRIRADLAAQHSGRTNLMIHVAHFAPPRLECTL